MKLKGVWSSETSYNVGDVVQWDVDTNVYHLQKPCKAGVPPVDTLYWGRVDQLTERCVQLILDGMATVAAKIPDNIDDDGIILKSGDDEYYITVDASGDEPEVVATLVEEEEEAADS